MTNITDMQRQRRPILSEDLDALLLLPAGGCMLQTGTPCHAKHASCFWCAHHNQNSGPSCSGPVRQLCVLIPTTRHAQMLHDQLSASHGRSGNLQAQFLQSIYRCLNVKSHGVANFQGLSAQIRGLLTIFNGECAQDERQARTNLQQNLLIDGLVDVVPGQPQLTLWVLKETTSIVQKKGSCSQPDGLWLCCAGASAY